jgi:hypothetical protein
MDMVIVWAISWWYGSGWLGQFARLRSQLSASYDYFSIGLLLRTLFSPFRQISAGRVDGPLGVKMRAFVDKLMSRFIGAFVRLGLVVAGTIWLILQAVIGMSGLLLWTIVPILPLFGFVMMLSGWVPAW